MKKILFAFTMLLAISACTNKPVSAVENNEESSQETNYFPAIDRYLADSIGSQYAKGEHCVPIHSIVRVDERNSEDILVWGDLRSSTLKIGRAHV